MLVSNTQKASSRSTRQASRDNAGGPLRAAFLQSISHGSFIDIEFFAFSSRRPSGVVHKPLPVYANSSLLMGSSDYFENLLGNDTPKSETFSNLDGVFPPNEMDSTEDYGYEDDSDLDEEEEEDCIDDLSSDSISDIVSTEDCIDLLVNGANPLPTASTNLKQSRASGVKGRVVVLPHIAYKTLLALMYYLGTGDIHFLPLKSQEVARQGNIHSTTPVRTGARVCQLPWCSPKSMYRLADMFSLGCLKQRAAKDILGKLSADNILDEYFSRFASRFSDIMDLELVRLRDLASTSNIMEKIPQVAEDFAKGKIPHGGIALSSLMKAVLQISMPLPLSPHSPPQHLDPSCFPLPLPPAMPSSEISPEGSNRQVRPTASSSSLSAPPNRISFTARGVPQTSNTDPPSKHSPSSYHNARPISVPSRCPSSSKNRTPSLLGPRPRSLKPMIKLDLLSEDEAIVVPTEAKSAPVVTFATYTLPTNPLNHGSPVKGSSSPIIAPRPIRKRRPRLTLHLASL